jgi:hypothetical protein
VIWWLDAMQIKPKQTLDGLSQLYSTDHSWEAMVWVICWLDAKIKPQTLYRCRANFSTDNSRKTNKQQSPSHLAHQSPSQPFKIIHYGIFVLCWCKKLYWILYKLRYYIQQIKTISLRDYSGDKLEVEVLKREIESEPG